MALCSWVASSLRLRLGACVPQAPGLHCQAGLVNLTKLRQLDLRWSADTCSGDLRLNGHSQVGALGERARRCTAVGGREAARLFKWAVGGTSMRGSRRKGPLRIGDCATRIAGVQGVGGLWRLLDCPGKHR
jgi:hypothetical protein